jgi:hypothetical protein
MCYLQPALDWTQSTEVNLVANEKRLVIELCALFFKVMELNTSRRLSKSLLCEHKVTGKDAFAAWPDDPSEH